MNLQIYPTSNLFVIILIISILVFYISYKGVPSSKRNIALLTLRLFVLVLLILLIFNPTIEKKGVYEKNLPWQIYLDKSLSIKYHKQPSEVAYKNGVKLFLNKLQDKKIIFETFSFGSSIDTVEELSLIEMNANSTNLSLIFNKINSDYQKNLGGVIIFTDGQINQGSTIQEFYSGNNRVPIYIIGIGDTTPMLDVFIRSIKSPPLGVKGENVNIDVIISSLGNINERVNVNLFDETNKLIGSKLITVSGNEENETIRFQIRPDKIGENNFFVKCSALSDEINIQNNQQKIKLHVMKDQYNIALVTGAPNYNTSLIKRHINEQGSNRVDHFILDSNNFNYQIKEFLKKKYEVIIFDNNPVLSNSNKWDSVLRVFTKKIISHNSSLFIIPGPEVNINSLNKYLKIIDLEAEVLDSDLQEGVKWRYLASWFELYSINDFEGSFNAFDSYPPQQPAFQIKNDLDDNESRSYAQYFGENFESPLLVLGEKQQIRYAIWNSINLASLKYMLSNSDLNFLYENSIRKITNWLMKKSDSREFLFRTDKNSYQHGELVSLTGVSTDLNNGYKIKDGIVELYHNDQYITSKPLMYDLNEKSYNSKFWAPKPGEIDYIIKVNRGLESYEVNNGTFQVRESHVELNKIFLNKNKLINLSESTGGFFRSWRDRDDIIPEVQNVNRIETYVSFFTFRYNYIYILIIILLLSLEWFFRKRNGLM